jgi:excisionase family DNA binding protein
MRRPTPLNGAAAADLAELSDVRQGRVLERRAFPGGQTSCWTTMADKDDILLNSREVAFLLDLSPDTVNEFARRNILPAFKKGRQWRFRKRDIASFKRHLRGVNAAA